MSTRISSVCCYLVSAIATLAVSVCYASPQPQAQPSQRSREASNFVIDPSRPYAYLKFDHIGSGIQRSEREPTSRIWFQLTNNCRVPITVNTFSVPDGSPKDEQGVMDRLVAVDPDRFVGNGMLRDGKIVPKPFVKVSPDELPRDYWFEVGSTQTIPPGKALLFSVPINHVGPRWYFEIPFHFANENGRFPHEPSIGGFPEMKFLYTLYDLPPAAQAQVERWYDRANSQTPSANSR